MPLLGFQEFHSTAEEFADVPAGGKRGTFLSSIPPSSSDAGYRIAIAE